MDALHRLMDILIASWVLTHEGSERRTGLPITPGLLDRALQNAVQKGTFGVSATEFSFVDSRTGLRCVELPEMLDFAEACMLLSIPDPSEHTAEIRISPNAARQLLRRHGVSEQDAKTWGALIRDEVRAATKLLRAYPQTASAIR